jgi:squalene-hopene/tetraprenyl-beta-curcumene cyclase
MVRTPSRSYVRYLLLFFVVQFTYAPEALVADDVLTLETVTEPEAFDPDEPLAESFSSLQAARALDQAALHWQKKRQCGTCHTNFAYLMARPALNSIRPTAPEVRPFFEDMVTRRWKEKGPRWDAEVVAAAVTLALNDRQTTGALHPVTRQALDRMCSLQAEDGGWDWLKCGWPPMESDDHYGVTFAAVGLGSAPSDYAHTAAGEAALEGVRKYLRVHPAPSLHHRAMLLWASTVVGGLLDHDARQPILAELFAKQRPDGGWAIAGLFADWSDHTRKDDEPQDTTSSDGYATGFVIYIARQVGVPADDLRLVRGLQWLKKNQRSSGRWFTPSPTKDSKHFISNAGTAFAALALHSCNALD